MSIALPLSMLLRHCTLSLALSMLCACSTYVAADPGKDPSQLDRPKPLDQPKDESVWKDTSLHLRVKTFSYWEGGSRFERDAADLDPVQLAALRGLKLATETGCAADVLTGTILITDADGTTTEYGVEEGDCEDTRPRLTEESLRGFLETLPCLTASQTRFDADDAPAPVIGADDGCEHGLFGSPPWLMLDVTEAGVPYTVEGVDCQHNQVKIDLYTADRTTLLAAGAPQPAPGCSRATYTFAKAGEYAIHVEGVQGDYFLKASHE